MSYFKRQPMGDPFWGSGTSGGTQPVPTQPTKPAGGGTPATTPPPDPTKSSGGSALDTFAKIFGALAISKIGSSQQQQQPGYIMPVQQQGMSTTTMLIAGGLGITALVLLLK